MRLVVNLMLTLYVFNNTDYIISKEYETSIINNQNIIVSYLFNPLKIPN